MASLDMAESMEEDFTGFEEEPIGVVVNPSGTAILDTEPTRMEETVNETDSDSGNLVIAEPEKKQAPKSTEKSPRKRKSKVEDITPTRAPSSRVRGQGLAYLIAMEKGGSKKQLAKAQAQADAQEASASLQTLPSDTSPAQEKALADCDPALGDSEAVKRDVAGATKEKDSSKGTKEPAKGNETSGVAKEKEDVLPEAGSSMQPHQESPAPAPVAAPVTKARTTSRKSFSAINISSPLLKEPFKEGWRREVVYRATVDPGNARTLCDVYYYAPDGKKLRSGREVSDYLEKSGSPLSSENFTFFKEPIGMDSSQEILRYAKTNRRVNEEDGGAEKQITKKEKALKAREDELRRNLQELGEDVAAITGNVPAQEGQPAGAPAESGSPLQKKKRGAKVEKQLKIKLWGKGLRSKENAEPVRRGDGTEGEEDVGAATAASSVGGKASPARALPDDISHLFTPLPAGAVTRGSNKALSHGQKPITTSGAETTDSSNAAQHLVLINGKRFISVGAGAESTRQPHPHEDSAMATNKRALSSPGINSHRQSPKRMKLSGATPAASAAQFSPRVKAGAFSFFSSEQFNNFVSHAYHGLLHVFRYLTVQELMAAAGVCKLWRDLALHHSHWRVVRLKNSRIYDWTSFASHLRRAGTQHLDMRKMLFVASAEETWANLERAASNLSEIRCIDLCKCPADVLYSIANHCHRLERIDAQFISSACISLDSLRSLSQLEELKIRSSSGMTLDDGLQAFASLTKLKYLSLTTISDLKSSELIHLAGLPLLEYLEVGDCSQWLEEADYCNLGQLPHVRHLRLEQGPCSSVIAYLDSALGAITSLQHVELVTFVFDAPMERLKASGLKRLLVIPRYTTETLATTMRHVFDSVVSMQQLQQLTWVVTDELINTLVDGKLPITLNGDGATEGGDVTISELEEHLRQRLPQTSVHVIRLPEYATHRYGLSVNQED